MITVLSLYAITLTTLALGLLITLIHFKLKGRK